MSRMDEIEEELKAHLGHTTDCEEADLYRRDVRYLIDRCRKLEKLAEVVKSADIPCEDCSKWKEPKYLNIEETLKALDTE